MAVDSWLRLWLGILARAKDRIFSYLEIEFLKIHDISNVNTYIQEEVL